MITNGFSLTKDVLVVREFVVGDADVVAPQINKSVENDAFVRVCVIGSCFVETLGCLSIPLAVETAFFFTFGLH